MEYDVAYGVRTMEQLMALITFFRAMRGRTYAFNYRDNVDYTSSIPTAFEARAAPAIGPYDQWIGTGDGSTTVFQLRQDLPDARRDVAGAPDHPARARHGRDRGQRLGLLALDGRQRRPAS